MLNVDQDLLEKLIDVVGQEIDKSDDIVDEIRQLVGDREKKIAAVLKALKDTAAYLCRRNLSGTEVSSPFDILLKITELIAEAKLLIYSGLKGVPLAEQDVVKETINKKLAERLKEIESTIEFSKRLGIIEKVEAEIGRRLDSRHVINLPEIVNKVAKEEEKKNRILEFTRKDAIKLADLVKEGRIYKFQADKLEKALLTLYHTGDRSALVAALEDLIKRR